MIDDNSKEFIKRHIGPSPEDQLKMLKHVGYNTLDDLMVNTVPVSYTHLTLPTICSV